MPEKKQKKILLIWPPLVRWRHLPLGIPFLASYLKKHLIHTSVLDLNSAYLEKRGVVDSLLEGYIPVNKENRPPESEGIPWSLEKILDHNFQNSIKKYEEIFLPLLRTYYRKSPTSHEPCPKENSSGDESPVWGKDKRDNPLLGSPGFEQITSGSCLEEETIHSIGISVIYPEQLFYALVLAKIIKTKIDKNIEIILGGVQITKHIKYLTCNQNIYHTIDYFITQDGEEPLLKLLSCISRKDLHHIPNLYHKNLDAYGYTKTERSFQLHPNNFPVPDFSGFDLSFYNGPVPLLASKGCFWSKCTFCTYPLLHAPLFSICRPVLIIDTIKFLKEKYGFGEFRFVDDALPAGFMKSLAAAMIKENLNIKWGTNIILSSEFKDRHLCLTLKKSGLSWVKIGIESISPRILRLMNKYQKNMNEEEVKEILASLQNAGIKNSLNIMYGFPTETVAEAKQTHEFLMKNKNLYNNFHVHLFSLEEDTYIFNHPEEFSISRIHIQDKNCGRRLGYHFENLEGMSRDTAKLFAYVYGQSKHLLKGTHLNQDPHKNN